MTKERHTHMPTAETTKQVLAAAAAAEDKKAEDIRILALDPADSGFADYFLICNGTNERQNVAISDGIEMQLKREFGVYPNSVEGRRQGEWVLMDYFDFVVHVFSAEKRAYYGLERLRKSAKTISIAELHAELNERLTAARARKTAAKKSPAKKTAVKKSVAGKPSTKATAKTAAKKPAPQKAAGAAKSKKATTKKAASKSPAKKAAKPRT